MDRAGNGTGTLTLEHMSTSYGGPDVVHQVSMEIHPGEIVALLGPNGAGKTTILNAISGLSRVTGGSISLGDLELHRLPPHRVVAAGVAHVLQGRRLFGYSTGAENLRLGAYIRRDEAEVDREIERFASDWPVVARVLDQIGHLMSGGEQQVIALCRALMSQPKILLLDEPSLGLAPILVGQLFQMIGSLVESQGDRFGVLLVEQNVRKALELAERVYVVVSGRIVAAAPSKELSPDDIVALYMGRAIDDEDGG